MFLKEARIWEKSYEIPFLMYEMYKNEELRFYHFHFVQPNGYFVHSHLCGFGSAGFFRNFALVKK